MKSEMDLRLTKKEMHGRSDEVTTTGSESKGLIKIKLDEINLWEKFRGFTNEMIVTKGGRRMFPVLKVSLANLDQRAMYSVQMDFQQVSGHRWKYVNGDWVPGSKAEQPAPKTVYVHPDSPNFGSHWMKEPISFSKVKLTNKSCGVGQVMLNSLHKYEPRVRIYKVGISGDLHLIEGKSFPQAQFIAVTAYQNEEITALKIKYNPFAKAFQDAKERPDQKECFESVHESQQQKHVPSLPGPWFMPTPTAPSLVPPTAHQFRNIPSPSCEKLPDRLALRGHRTSPYAHALPRYSPPHGNLPKEVGPYIPVLDMTETWHVPTHSHSVFSTSGGPSSVQNQYIWSLPGLAEQNCAMTPQFFMRPNNVTVTTEPSNITLPVSSSAIISTQSQVYECQSEATYVPPIFSRNTRETSNRSAHAWSALPPPTV